LYVFYGTATDFNSMSNEDTLNYCTFVDIDAAGTLTLQSLIHAFISIEDRFHTLKAHLTT